MFVLRCREFYDCTHALALVVADTLQGTYFKSVVDELKLVIAYFNKSGKSKSHLKTIFELEQQQKHQKKKPTIEKVIAPEWYKNLSKGKRSSLAKIVWRELANAEDDQPEQTTHDEIIRLLSLKFKISPDLARSCLGYVLYELSLSGLLSKRSFGIPKPVIVRWLSYGKCTKKILQLEDALKVSFFSFEVSFHFPFLFFPFADISSSSNKIFRC